MENRHVTLLVQKGKEQRYPNQLVFKQSPPGHFECFIASFNFILIIPFRLQRSSLGNVTTCKQNIFHQIICAISLILGLFWAVSQFLLVITTNIYEKPAMLFGVVIYGVSIIYTVVFFHVFWGSTNKILNFANLSSSNYLSYRKLFYIILTVYPLILNVLLIYPFRRAIFFPVQDQWYMHLFQAVKITGFLANVILNNFIDTYIPTLALSGYDIVRKNLAILEHLRKSSIARKEWQNGDFSRLIDIAERLQTFFTTLNSVGSPIFLAWFCMLVVWVSHKLVDTLPGTRRTLSGEGESLLNPWKNMLYYWVFFGLYIATLVLCAEIKRECDNIHRTMKQIILQYDQILSFGTGVLAHIELSLDNVGIFGGYFFKFSYGFLGSTAGLVVAYTFLSLQLQTAC